MLLAYAACRRDIDPFILVVTPTRADAELPIVVRPIVVKGAGVMYADLDTLLRNVFTSRFAHVQSLPADALDSLPLDRIELELGMLRPRETTIAWLVQCRTIRRLHGDSIRVLIRAPLTLRGELQGSPSRSVQETLSRLREQTDLLGLTKCVLPEVF